MYECVPPFIFLTCCFSGAQAEVHEAINIATGEAVAIKVLDKRMISSIEHIRHEISILHNLDHPGIIKLLDIFETDTELLLVMEMYAVYGFAV